MLTAQTRQIKTETDRFCKIVQNPSNFFNFTVLEITVNGKTDEYELRQLASSEAETFQLLKRVDSHLHVVKFHNDQDADCTCKSFKYRTSNCKHIACLRALRAKGKI